MGIPLPTHPSSTLPLPTCKPINWLVTSARRSWMPRKRKYSSLNSVKKRFSPSSRPVLSVVYKYVQVLDLSEIVCLYALPIVEFCAATLSSQRLWRFDSTEVLGDLSHPWRLSVPMQPSSTLLTVTLVDTKSLRKTNITDYWFCSSTAGVHRSTNAVCLLFKQKGVKANAERPVDESIPSELEFTDHIRGQVGNLTASLGTRTDFLNYRIRIEIKANQDTVPPAIDFTASYLS